MCITSMHRVCTRSKRLSLLTSVRCVACSLTVGYIRCDRKDGSCRDTISVGMMSSDRCHELVNDILCDQVNTVVVVTIFRELACRLKINDDAVFVADRLNLRILDR